MALTPAQLLAIQQSAAAVSGTLPGAGVRYKTPKKKTDYSFGGFVGNLGSGLYDLAAGLPAGIYGLGKAAVHDYGVAYSGKGSYQLDDIGSAIAHDFSRRYKPLAQGDFKKFAKMAYEEPASYGLDALTAASGGAAAAGKVAGVAAKSGRAGGIASRISGTKIVAPSELGMSRVAASTRGGSRIKSGPNAGKWLMPKTREFNISTGKKVKGADIDLPRNPLSRGRVNLKEHLLEKVSKDKDSGIRGYFNPDARGPRMQDKRQTRIDNREAMAATAAAEHAVSGLSKAKQEALFYLSTGFRSADELIPERQRALDETIENLKTETDPHGKARELSNKLHLERDIQRLKTEKVATAIAEGVNAPDVANAEALLRVAHEAVQKVRRQRNEHETVETQAARASQPLRDVLGLSDEEIALRNPMIVSLSENRKILAKANKSMNAKRAAGVWGSNKESTGYAFRKALYEPNARRITDQLRQELSHKGALRNLETVKGLMVPYDPLRHTEGLASGKLVRIEGKGPEAQKIGKSLTDIAHAVDENFAPWAVGKSADDVADMREGIQAVIDEFNGEGPTVIPAATLKELTAQAAVAKGYIAEMLAMPTEVWRSFVLSLKGSFYVNNFVGNMLLGMVSHGAFKFPKELIVAGSKKTSMGALVEKHFPDASRTGFAREVSKRDLELATGLKHPINSFQKIAEYVAGKGAPGTEDIFRRASVSLLLKESAKRLEKNTGMSKAESIRGVLNDADAVDNIFQEMSGNMLDYSALTPFERNKLRPLFPFWAFTRSIFGRSFKLTMDEPWKVEVMGRLSEEGVRQNEQVLGEDIPNYLKGLILTGEKDKEGLPRAVSAYAGNPFASVADTTAQIASLVSDDPRLDDSNVLSSMNPFLKSAIDAKFRKDTFTQQPLTGSTAEIYGKQLAMNFPAYGMYQKYQNPSLSPALQRDLSDTLSSYAGLSQGSVNVPNIRRNVAIQKYFDQKAVADAKRREAKLEAAAVKAGRR